jgi:surface polysaccharide O-acyltransferase-like enzyme
VKLLWWQQLLLGIVVFTSVGTLAELILLEHIEERTQMIPVLLLGVVIVATVVLWMRPVPAVINAYRVIMIACLASALLGIYFHYTANVEFVLERHPKMTGWALTKEAAMGALPALAPGTMAQLALIGLLATVSRRSA